MNDKEREIIKDFIDAGIVPSVSPETEQKILNSEQQDSNSIVYEILYSNNLIYWFDSEADTNPPDYVQLLSELCEITGGKINPMVINQDIGAGPMVQVDFGDKDYIITMRDISDYYDVEKIITGMNFVAYKLKVKERFFCLPTGDQTVLVTWADEEKFKDLVEKYKIRIDKYKKYPDKNTAMLLDILGKMIKRDKNK